MTVKIFCSYAREDELLLFKLEKHLKLLQRQGILDFWDDHAIKPGSEWKQEVNRHLNAAQIILLLISPDYIASDYLYNIEMRRALERYEQEEAVVIPIILSPCLWKDAPFEKLQVLPTNAEPVVSWSNKEDAFSDIAKNIHKLVNELADKTFIRNIEPFITVNNSIIDGNIPNNRSNTIKMFILGPLGSGKTTAVQYIHKHARERNYNVENITEYDILKQMYPSDTRQHDFTDFAVLTDVSRILEKNVEARSITDQNDAIYHNSQLKLITIELNHPRRCLDLSHFNAVFLRDAYFIFTDIDLGKYLERRENRENNIIYDEITYKSHIVMRWNEFYPENSWKRVVRSLDHNYNKFQRIDNNMITKREFYDLVRDFIDLIISVENIRSNEKRGIVTL